MGIRRDWDLDFDVDDVLWSQGADPAVIRGRRPQLVELAQRALEEGRGLLDPAVLTRRLSVESSRHNRVTLEGGRTLTGPLITEHLGGAETVVVIVCTVGGRLERAARERSSDEVGFALALDAVGSAAVHSLTAAACNVLEREARAGGLQTSLPLSPGMEGWEVDPGQREIFSIVDPGPLGVELSPTLEMVPLKSTSAILGIGSGLVSMGAICDYCSMRDTCRHRIA